MTDRRLLAATDAVADRALEGRIKGRRFVDPLPLQVVTVAPFLHRGPGGVRDRQLLYGDPFAAIESRGAWTFGRSEKDGYCGWIETAAIGAARASSHAVALRHTHAYPAADLKRPPAMRLPFGARVEVRELDGPWAVSAAGWIPAGHLRPLEAPMTDPVAVAALFLGTPYLWAGNTGDGIDCSGLVQAACHACGLPCPGDSDLQAEALGAPLADETPLSRNDVLFWPGHVALVADETRLLHATGNAMAVVYEEIAVALARIEAQGHGRPKARRLTPPAG